ncbi:MFS transporter [Sphingobium sp.]|uniref:MFS transporter n=1 Tax=Sphingobium sp. TaxID=1912891 RepID=UPI003B3AE557
MKIWYKWYVLIVLILIYMVNQIDRQIITILAPFLKKDLALTDAQLGLLYGTAFALFYGVFGIPLSRLADAWHRVRTLWGGLLFWSMMTALSGLSGNFVHLSLARVGVGIGEASASPAAISLLGDLFDKKQRSTILSLYTTGSYLGIGASLVVGGAIVTAWNGMFPDVAAAPFQLTGWQAAFFGVGIPGLLLAMLVALTIKEPVPGELEGLPQHNAKLPLAVVLYDLAVMIPPFSFFLIARRGTAIQLARNLLAALIIATMAICTISLTDHLLTPAKRAPIARLGDFVLTTNVVQWTAIGVAVYAVISWLQAVRLHDGVTYRLTAGSRTFVALLLVSGFMGICANSLFAFVFLYASRYLGFGAHDGLLLGAIGAATGVFGASLGGLLGDRAKLRHPAGRIFVSIGAMLLLLLFSMIQYLTDSRSLFLVAFTLASIAMTLWVGCLHATAQDLVLPRMRGIAFALKALSTSVIGLGLGPYVVGLISDINGDLRGAILLSLTSIPCAILCLLYVARNLGHEEQSVLARARAAGEPLPVPIAA